MIVHAYYPLGETRVERQAQALLLQGIEVDIICLRLPHEPLLENVDGVRVHRLPVRRHKSVKRSSIAQLFEYLAFFALAFIRLIRLNRQRRYSVVQVHSPPDFLVFVALICKLTDAKVILDLHDLMPEFSAERFQQSLDSLVVRLMCWQEWLACYCADHVITVTELWRQRLIDRGQPANKVSVVMNVPDNRIFHRDVTKHTPRENNRFCLIYHGIMGHRHGLDLALRAINLVRQNAPDVHLTLHGGGESLGALIKLANELGLQDHVQFDSHFVETAELAKLLKDADLAVIPYRNDVFTSEILPTKLMEYAALGIPVIAARTKAIESYFDDTMVEFFTPGSVDELAGCIMRLHNDRARLAQLAQGIQKFNQRYNWKKLGAEYVALVEQLSTK